MSNMTLYFGALGPSFRSNVKRFMKFARRKNILHGGNAKVNKITFDFERKSEAIKMFPVSFYTYLFWSHKKNFGMNHVLIEFVGGQSVRCTDISKEDFVLSWSIF